MPEIMRWLKAATANRSNLLLARQGRACWQREYFDRWIGSDEKLESVMSSFTWGTTRFAKGWPACAKGVAAVQCLPCTYGIDHRCYHYPDAVRVDKALRRVCTSSSTWNGLRTKLQGWAAPTVARASFSS